MSRDKFEAWAYEIENFSMRMDRLLDQSGTDGAMFAAWLAGRESMRDEAAEKCMKVEADEDYRICIDTDTAVALCLEIKNIEP